MPGALYTDTCPCGAAEDVKVFEIAAVQAKVVYNDYGWHDPQGRFFVLKEDVAREGTLDNYLAKVECGEIRPEPLILRVNAGDCVEVRLTNLLPERIDANAFQMETITDIVGFHIHLVKFDTIVSDGAANGWNNIAGGRPCETLVERFFAHEEQHVFNLTGLPWRKEITDPVSPLVQSQTIGISEAFNLRIDEPYGAGDYLYYSGGIDDLWLGLWGILRAYAVPQKDLLPLCGMCPIAAPQTPPPGAVVRKFDIAAIQKDLRYNSFGDHDPEGLLFVPLEQARDVLCGCRKAVPLILRVNAGDWIEVTLHNLFDPCKPIQWNEYPSVPVEFPHIPSDRVSLNPQF